MQVRVSHKHKYLLDIDSRPFVFDKVKEAINFLADRNYPLPEICELDFEIEEA